MKKYLFAVTIIVGSVLWIAACSKGNSPDNNNPGIAIIPPSQCPAGMIPQGAVCVPNSGYYGGSFYTMIVGPYYADIQNNDAYINFLKNAMGTCDRNLWDWGTSSCDSWINGGIEIDIFVSDVASRKVNVVFMAWPSTFNSFANYYGSFNINFGFSQAYYNPMTFVNLEAPVINQGQGFYIRTKGPYGSAAWNQTIQIKVPYGNLTDNGWEDVEFSYGSNVIAVGTAQKL